MNSRYLCFLIILVLRVIVSCSWVYSSSNVRRDITIYDLSHTMNLDYIPVESSGMIFNALKLTMELTFLDMQDTLSKSKETVLKPVQALSQEMVIQVGAFFHESNALSLRERLSDMLNKTVIIDHADGYFKVRITGLKSSEEIEKLLPALGLLGIKNVWIFLAHKKEDIKFQAVAKADSLFMPAMDKINLSVIAKAKPVVAENEPVLSTPTMNLQVGIFHSKSEALRAKRKITTKLNLPVEIVKEWEYYIVFITGFKTRDEIFKYYPKLAALGYPDSFMIDNNYGTGKNN
jgi:hypothetical protein